MPLRSNTQSDIGTSKVSSDSYDTNNIFLTDQGWVYRHFKNNDKSEFWDEIIVAGEAGYTDPADDVTATLYSLEGGGSEAFAPAGFEGTTDGAVDIQYSPSFVPMADAAVGPARYPFPDADADAPEEGSGSGGGGGAAAPADPVATNVTLTLIEATPGNTAYITSAALTGGTVDINVGDILTITNGTGGHSVAIVESDGGEPTTQGTTTGSGADTLVWNTSGVTAGTFYYQCQAHEAMIGTINVN